MSRKDENDNLLRTQLCNWSQSLIKWSSFDASHFSASLDKLTRYSLTLIFWKFTSCLESIKQAVLGSGDTMVCVMMQTN